MANMSYCRFRNTIKDLFDCYEHLDEIDDLVEGEEDARIQLIQLCCEIAEEYGEDVED